MPNQRRTPWKADLKWFLFFAALAKVGLILFIDLGRPELHDLEYGARVARLRERVAEAPGRPLCLVIGSSRIALGFLPERLPPLKTADGEVVAPFNFGHIGGGPVMNLMELQRLLQEGIHPRWFVLEVVPLLMEQPRTSLAMEMATGPDLALLQPYTSAAKVWAVYLRRRINPWFTDRLNLLRRYVPRWATDGGGEDCVRIGPLGGDDHWCLEDALDSATKQRRIAAIRDSDRGDLQNYHIDPAPDRALRDCLDLCRRERIECALLITPESAEYQSWYRPGGLDCFRSYCESVSAEHGAPTVDAESWIPDDGFSDATHPLRPGAEAFTGRLGRELLQPLVEGRLRRAAIR